MAVFSIAHLYPDLLNLYGDRGNLLCLQQRMRWYGHDCRIKNIHLETAWTIRVWICCLWVEDLIGNRVGLSRPGQAFGQLAESHRGGMPVLCICGAYQLLSSNYMALDGRLMQGLKFFNFTTRGGN